MSVLVFSGIVSELFLILRRMILKVTVINVHKSLYKVYIFFNILINLEFSRQNFQKSFNIKRPEHPYSWMRCVPCELKSIEN